MLRARTLTAIILRHPYLLHDLEEAYGSLPLPEAMRRLRDAILAHAAQSPGARDEDVAAPLDSAGLINHLHALGLTEEVSVALDQTPSCALTHSQAAEAEAGWWHFYGLMHRDGLEEAVDAARRTYEQTQDPAAFARLNALCIARDRLRRGEGAEDDQEAGDQFDG
jgi:DNA primase